ncbi:hypothetical protein FQA39_LY12782 [Lamprigera yunnana]|nr:hypothetical protein FQA39_LY12782 [Lamprigera yunnana]
MQFMKQLHLQNIMLFLSKKTKKANETVYNLVTKENFDQVLKTAQSKLNKLAKDASEIKNLKVTILTKKDAEKLGMGLLLAVNAGSSVEARVVVLEYTGDASKPKTALVGKGITFDSGGYNLKPSNFMEAKAEAKTNVVAVGMFTDNRIGHTATLPESVIKSMNGLTVEIDNTDAEGRLVLADGITYAIREMKAEKVYEASTLTGAIAIALGR